MSWSGRVMMSRLLMTRTMATTPRVASRSSVWTRGKQTSAQDQQKPEMKKEEMIVKRFEEVAHDNDVNDDDEGYEETMMDYFMKRARIELDDLDSAEYHDITSYDKKLFHKVVDLWLDDVGPTKKGHRQFVRAAINSLQRFNIQQDLPAYLKLLECFPNNQHTGIRRSHPFFSAFGDKFPDHQLGADLLRAISFNQVDVDDRLYIKTVDLFGVYSPVSRQARNLMYWNPRMQAFNPHPVASDACGVTEMGSAEVATRALHQMGGADLSATYRRVESECGEGLVCYQGDVHRLRLNEHDPTKPIHIRGPHICYLANRKVEYYVMSGETRKEDEQKDQELEHVSSKEWWSDFYGKDWSSDKKMMKKEGVYGDESFLPVVEMSDEHGLELEDEISEVKGDYGEGSVYAICAPTSDHQLDQVASVELLRAWTRDLVDDGNIKLKNCNVVFSTNNKTKSFMHDAPLEDPNSDDEFF